MNKSEHSSISDFFSIKSYTYSREELIKERKQLISWLDLINTSYRGTDITLFHSFHLYDQYINKTNYKQNNKELIAVVCFFISYKLHEPYFLSIKSIQIKILDSLYTLKEIKDTEKKILRALNFRIMDQNIFNCVTEIMANIKLFSSEDFFDFLNDIIKKTIKESLEITKLKFKTTAFEFSVLFVSACLKSMKKNRELQDEVEIIEQVFQGSYLSRLDIVNTDLLIQYLYGKLEF